MALTLITTNTSSNASSSSFTSGIDSTYKLYIFKYYDVNPATDNQNFTFQGNVVGQSGYNETITSAYFSNRHNEAGDDTTLAYDSDRHQNQETGYQVLNGGVGNGGDESVAGELFLFNPSNTTYIKHWYSVSQMYNGSNYSEQAYAGGYFNVTGAIDEISFKFASGNFDGTIKMYGVG